jgi:hypothetical protein
MIIIFNNFFLFRALGICLFLLLFPIGLVLFLWNNFTMGTWLLAGIYKDKITRFRWDKILYSWMGMSL